MHAQKKNTDPDIWRIKPIYATLRMRKFLCGDAKNMGFKTGCLNIDMICQVICTYLFNIEILFWPVVIENWMVGYVVPAFNGADDANEWSWFSKVNVLLHISRPS